MRGRLDLQHEQHERRDDEDQAKPVDRQHAQAVDRQGQARHADEAGHPCPGMCELDLQRQHSDGQQDEHNVGVRHDQQQLLDQAHLHGLGDRAGGLQAYAVRPAWSPTKPSNCFSRSAWLRAILSISPASSASVAETALA